MIDTGDIDVYLGLDVGRGEHHATAVTPAGKKAFRKRLPNSEPKSHWTVISMMCPRRFAEELTLCPCSGINGRVQRPPAAPSCQSAPAAVRVPLARGMVTHRESLLVDASRVGRLAPTREMQAPRDQHRRHQGYQPPPDSRAPADDAHADGQGPDHGDGGPDPSRDGVPLVVVSTHVPASQHLPTL